jgi:hypothetical protein
MGQHVAVFLLERRLIRAEHNRSEYTGDELPLLGMRLGERGLRSRGPVDRRGADRSEDQQGEQHQRRNDDLRSATAKSTGTRTATDHKALTAQTLYQAKIKI